MIWLWKQYCPAGQVGPTLALLLLAGTFGVAATGTLFGAPVIKRYGQLVADTAFEPAGFPLALGLKDVNLALGAGEELRVPLPLASLVRERMLTALAQGRERFDWSGFASVIREAAGLEPVRGPK